MTVLMTGFAARKGQGGWCRLIREGAVHHNDKGLGLRLRLPFRIGGPGPRVRARLARQVQRGTVSLPLKLTRAGRVQCPFG